MAKNTTYSRLKRVEKQKNIRSAYLYIFLTIGLIALLFFAGIPALSKFAGFIFDLGSSKNPVEIQDNTPPPPPRFSNFPEYTNQKSVQLEGTSEAGSQVAVIFNGDKKEVLADSSGQFSVSITLQNGENWFYAVAQDKAQNQSTESERYTIVFDDTPPEITISEPQGGQSFSGDEKQITVKGSVNEEARVSVNGQVAIVNENNEFSVSIPLNSGNNDLKVQATDKAGNEAEKQISVTYSS